MRILLYGVSHKTAPVEFRENLAFPPGELKNILECLGEECHLDEAVVLSTCRHEGRCTSGGATSARKAAMSSAGRKPPAASPSSFSTASAKTTPIAVALRLRTGLESPDAVYQDAP